MGHSDAIMDRALRYDDYALKSVIGGLGISERTFHNWRKRGFAPRQLKGGRVARAELDAWVAQLRKDQENKPSLRHPAKPLGWVADRSPFDAAAHVAAEQQLERRAEAEIGEELRALLALSTEQLASIMRIARRLRHGGGEEV